MNLTRLKLQFIHTSHIATWLMLLQMVFISCFHSIIWRWSLFLGGSLCRTLLSGHLVSANTYSYRCSKHVIKTWQIRVEELVLNDFLHHRNENRIVTMRKNQQVCCIYLASTLWQFCSHQEYHDSMFPYSQWVDGGSNDESKIVAAPRLACYIWIYIRFVSDAFNQRHRIVEDIQYDYILMVNVTIA